MLLLWLKKTNMLPWPMRLECLSSSIENLQIYTTVASTLREDLLNLVDADPLKNVPDIILQMEKNSADRIVATYGIQAFFFQNQLPVRRYT